MRNNLNCRLKIIGIAALSLALYAAPAIARERDLLELYTLAKTRDPAVARADARLEAGRADKDIAWAAVIPRVSANASVRQLWTNVTDYTPEPITGRYTGYSYGIGTGIPIFNMPAYYQIAAAGTGITSAETGVQAARQDLIVRLLDGYVRYLKAQADEKLYRDEMGRVGKVLGQSEAFLKAGTGDVIAVYEARARLDSAAADLVKTGGQLRLAQQNLASLTGVAVDAVRDMTVTAAGPEPAEMEWWLETMRQRSPALLQAREDLLQSEELRKGAGAGHYPTLSGNAGYTVDKGSTFLPKVVTEQWYAGVQLNVPIYSGGDTSARTRRARAGEAERRAMLDDAREQGIRRLKEAYLNLQYNVSLLEAYRRKQESAELQLKAVQKGRDIGTRTAIDLLNSEQTYAISRRDLTAAMYDNLQRRLELKAAAGILAEDDLRELSGMPVKDNK
ncbi:MAG: TolC family protein [Desulfuromonadaceae bacterium]|nr:TolC family protein [Desulfuromonadaceae bacterium]